MQIQLYSVWWKPDSQEEESVTTVGNFDWLRSWQTVVSAWAPDIPCYTLWYSNTQTPIVMKAAVFDKTFCWIDVDITWSRYKYLQKQPKNEKKKFSYHILPVHISLENWIYDSKLHLAKRFLSVLGSYGYSIWFACKYQLPFELWGSSHMLEAVCKQ